MESAAFALSLFRSGLCKLLLFVEQLAPRFEAVKQTGEQMAKQLIEERWTVIEFFLLQFEFE